MHTCRSGPRPSRIPAPLPGPKTKMTAPRQDDGTTILVKVLMGTAFQHSVIHATFNNIWAVSGISGAIPPPTHTHTERRHTPTHTTIHTSWSCSMLGNVRKGFRQEKRPAKKNMCEAPFFITARSRDEIMITYARMGASTLHTTSHNTTQ